jgi:hypothetical protein
MAFSWCNKRTEVNMNEPEGILLLLEFVESVLYCLGVFKVSCEDFFTEQADC